MLGLPKNSVKKVCKRRKNAAVHRNQKCGLRFIIGWNCAFVLSKNSLSVVKVFNFLWIAFIFPIKVFQEMTSFEKHLKNVLKSAFLGLFCKNTEGA